ncbi:hypothetical protein BT96DRAFT_938054 [Gymnopus androsaceus JB14]|uniref:Uncharacterized protein n=1 Tax=Gymnopus androsaceus JB14 TaxID=1447944 RepID=A0A6A4HTT6_9AGAR|nr:hypothetical protein BT96DRAFT_938054 [Gymnopus androsaceus JB14]
MDKKDQAKSTFDDLGNQVTVTIPQQVNILDEAVGYKAPGILLPPPKQAPALHINELTKKLEALTLAINMIQECKTWAETDGIANKGQSIVLFVVILVVRMVFILLAQGFVLKQMV